MARPEVVIDGSTLEGQFALGLRALREKKRLDYQTMAKIANFAPSTLSKAASGRGLPTLAVTLAYVRACGGRESEWEAEWHRVYAAVERRREAIAHRFGQRSHPARQGRETGKEGDPESTEQFTRVEDSTSVQEEEGTAAEPHQPADKRTGWGRRSVIAMLLAFVCSAAGTPVAPAVITSRTELSYAMAPTAGAPSVQPFVIWDADGGTLPLVVGETTRRVDLWNPNSTDLVVARLNVKPTSLPDDSSSNSQRCDTESVKIANLQQESYSVAAHETKRIEFTFVVLSSLPDNCEGRTVRVDYTGKAAQWATVEGASLPR